MNHNIKPHSPTGNLFLDLALPDQDTVDKYTENKMNFSRTTRFDPENFVYFPIDSIVSLSVDLASGFTADIRQVGREGFFGFAAIINQRGPITTAIAQTPGSAFRVRSEIVSNTFETSTQFRKSILQYMQALMQEAAQNVICNRFHAIEQQFCSTLLLAADRLGSTTIRLTHEQLAVIMGCRREAVSLAARKLQIAGIIKSSYGQLVIADPQALKRHSCECYICIRSAFSAFTGGSAAGVGLPILQGKSKGQEP